MYSMLTEAVATQQIAERRQQAAAVSRAYPGRPVWPAVRRPRKPAAPRSARQHGGCQALPSVAHATCE